MGLVCSIKMQSVVMLRASIEENIIYFTSMFTREGGVLEKVSEDQCYFPHSFCHRMGLFSCTLQKTVVSAFCNGEFSVHMQDGLLVIAKGNSGTSNPEIQGKYFCSR